MISTPEPQPPVLTQNIGRGLAACISSGLSVEDTARACVESKVDIIAVQHQASLRNILAIQHRYRVSTQKGRFDILRGSQANMTTWPPLGKITIIHCFQIRKQDVKSSSK